MWAKIRELGEKRDTGSDTLPYHGLEDKLNLFLMLSVTFESLEKNKFWVYSFKDLDSTIANKDW